MWDRPARSIVHGVVDGGRGVWDLSPAGAGRLGGPREARNGCGARWLVFLLPPDVVLSLLGMGRTVLVAVIVLWPLDRGL